MIIRTCFRHLLAAGLAALLAPSAFAIDSVSIEAGGGDNTQLVRVGLQSQWQKKWLQLDSSRVDGYWDLTLSQWRWTSRQGGIHTDQNLYDLGITPVLRWQSDSQKGLYAELGIGAHLLSADFNDSEGRQFSTRFQFGDHFGLGYVMQNGLDISLKIQHFSNGAIKQPNPGVLFGVLKLGYAF